MKSTARFSSNSIRSWAGAAWRWIAALALVAALLPVDGLAWASEEASAAVSAGATAISVVIEDEEDDAEGAAEESSGTEEEPAGTDADADATDGDSDGEQALEAAIEDEASSDEAAEEEPAQDAAGLDGDDASSEAAETAEGDASCPEESQEDGDDDAAEAVTSVSEDSGVVGSVTLDAEVLSGVEDSVAEPSAQAEAEEAGESADFMDDDEYVLAYADASLAGSADEAAPSDYVYVVYTLADGTQLEEGTGDELWDPDGNDGEAYLAQFTAWYLLYELDEAADYYVARVDANLSSEFELTDWAATANDESGTLRADVIYDEETGLLYVPKSYLTYDDDEGAWVLGSTRFQMYYCSTGSDVADDLLAVESEVEVELIGADGYEGLATDGEGSVSALADVFYVLLASEDGALSAEDVVSVSVNGAELSADSGAWSYNEETGVLAVSCYPSAVRTVEVELAESNEEETLLSSLSETLTGLVASATGAEEADAATAESSTWTDYTVWDDDTAQITSTITFSSTPTAGDLYVVSGTLAYASYGTEFTTQQSDGVYVKASTPRSESYSSVDAYSAALLLLIVDWDAYHDNSNYYVDYSSVTPIMNYTFKANLSTGTYTESSSSETMAISGDNIRVLLGCSHNTDALDSTVSVGATTFYVRVLAVDADDGYVLLGIATTGSVNSQAGSGVVMASYTIANGEIEIQKTSSDTSLTSGNSSYSLSGAVYGVYSDSSCTTLVATMETDSSGCASCTVPVGTYYVKEVSASEGYSVSTTVSKATVSSSSTTSLTVYEAPLTGSVQLTKSSSDSTVSSASSYYSLSGAVYGVYSDSSCTTLVTTMTTNSSGVATATGLALGTYYVLELTAPAGFSLSSTVYTVSITSSNCSTAQTVSASDAPSTVSLEIAKSTTGVTDAAASVDASFSFTVNLYTSSGSALSGSYAYVVYDSSGSSVRTGSVADGGTITLASGQYAVVSGLPLGAKYKVTEDEDAAAEYGYECTSPSGGYRSGTLSTTAGGTTTASFVNAYSTSGSFTASVAKVLENFVGSSYSAGSYTFRLSSYGDDAGSVTRTVTVSGEGTASFSSVSLSAPGTYYYTIVETTSSTSYMTADSHTCYVKVVAVDDGYGSLSCTVSYASGYSGTYYEASSATANVFTNVYDTVELSISKSVVDATEACEGQEFAVAVVLTDASGTALTGSYPYTVTDSDGNVTGSGTVESGGAVYLEDGETATVTGLPAYVSYSLSEAEYDGYEASWSARTGTISAGGSKSATVTNTYSVYGEFQISATKIYESLLSGALTAGTFSFVLADSSGAVVATAVNDSSGEVSFDAVGLDRPGTYVYTLYEAAGSSAALVYDDAVYTVTVTAVDDGHGTLTCSYVVVDGDGATVEEAVFTNSDSPGSLSVTKAVLGGTYAADGAEFAVTVVLTDPYGEELEGSYPYTVTDSDGDVTASGTLVSGGSVLLEDGETLLVEEVPAYALYTVSETSYDGYTSVVSGAAGEIRSNQTSTVFVVNAYSASGSVSLSASKSVEGRALVANKFVFYLIDEDGDVAATASNDADGVVSFSLSFDSSSLDLSEGPVELTYTLCEGDASDGYAKDDAVYTVVVTVSDDGAGTLSCDVSVRDEDGGAVDEDGVAFVNEYHASGSVSLVAYKTVEGAVSAAYAGQFYFVAVDSSGAVVATGTNDADGLVTFSAIEYDETDAGETYTYTVYEVEGDDEDVVYDGTVYEFTVTVYDDGDGTLSFDVSSPSSPVFDNGLEPGELTVEKIVSEDSSDDGLLADFTFAIVLLGSGVEDLESLEYELSRVYAASSTTSSSAVDLEATAAAKLAAQAAYEDARDCAEEASDEAELSVGVYSLLSKSLAEAVPAALSEAASAVASALRAAASGLASLLAGAKTAWADEAGEEEGSSDAPTSVTDGSSVVELASASSLDDDVAAASVGDTAVEHISSTYGEEYILSATTDLTDYINKIATTADNVSYSWGDDYSSYGTISSYTCSVSGDGEEIAFAMKYSSTSTTTYGSSSTTLAQAAAGDYVLKLTFTDTDSGLYGQAVDIVVYVTYVYIIPDSGEYGNDSTYTSVIYVNDSGLCIGADSGNEYRNWNSFIRVCFQIGVYWSGTTTLVTSSHGDYDAASGVYVRASSLRYYTTIGSTTYPTSVSFSYGGFASGKFWVLQSCLLEYTDTYRYTNPSSSITNEQSIVYAYSSSTASMKIHAYVYKSTNLRFYTPQSFTVTLESYDGSTVYDVLCFSRDDGFGTSSTTSATLSTDESTSRTGYTFVGWSTSANSSSATYSDGYSYEETESIVLYAAYTANAYTIKYDANGGSGAPSSQTKTYGTSLTLSSTTPTRTGYTFLGWSTSSSATTATYSAGATLSTDLSSTDGATVTLYAVWQANTYSVTYYVNGGTASSSYSSPHAVTRTYGSSYTLLTIATLGWYRTGYTFSGWATSSSGSVSYADGASVSATLASALTLYAKWTANTYYVAFDANSDYASGSMSTLTMTYGTYKTLTANAYSLNGYTFTGWNTKADGTGDSYKDGASVRNLTSTAGATVTLYAQWELTGYVVSFDSNASGTVGSLADRTWSVSGGDEVPDNPYYRFGYTFTGWNTKADGSGTWLYPGDVTTASQLGSGGSSVTLYAQWEETDTTVSVADGVLYVTLHGGEAATFELPAGTSYLVYELTTDGWVLVDASGDDEDDGETVWGEVESNVEKTATFENEADDGETTAYVSVRLAGTKTLDGEGAEKGAFYFGLYDSSGSLVEAVYNKSGGVVSFSALTFSAAGTYVYTIKEVAGSDSSVDYDSTVWTATVVVSEDDDGALSASVSYTSSAGATAQAFSFENATEPGYLRITKAAEGAELSGQSFSGTVSWSDGTSESFTLDSSNGWTWTSGEVAAGTTYVVSETSMPDGWALLSAEGASGTISAGETSECVLTNSYTATASFTVKATKELSGGELQAGQFSFALYDSSGELVATATNDADGLVEFPEMTVSGEGTWTYTIEEVAGSDDDVEYDSHTAVVTVTASSDGEGGLDVTVSYGATASTSNVFSNSVRTGSLSVSKTVVGGLSGTAGQEFALTVTLLSSAGAVLDGSYPYTVTDSEGNVTGSGSLSSGGVLVLEDGETATVTGLPVGSYYVVSEASYPGYSASFTGQAGTVSADEAAECVVTNTYSASGTFTVVAEKVLEGRSIVSGEFEFRLYDSDLNLVETAWVSSDGSVTFSPVEVTEEGEWTYYVLEAAGDDESVVYDAHAAVVTVVGVDDGEGNIVCTVEYGSSSLNSNTFTNVDYGELLVSKVVVGGTAACAGQEFELTVVLLDSSGSALSGSYAYSIEDSDGNVTGSGELKSGGVIVLEDGETARISGLPDGTAYSVSEAEYAGYSTGISGGEGVIDVESGASSCVVTNAYSASGSFTIEATKTLVGDALAAGAYTFVLYDADGDVVEEATNDADGNVVFSAIEVTGSGTWTYTIVESDGGDPDVEYDDHVATVEVVGVDDGKGNVVCTVTYGSEDDDADPAFLNRYLNGWIEITKTVVGATEACDGQGFEVTVTLLDSTLSTLSGTYPYEVVDSDGNVTASGEFASGGTLLLEDGETAYIRDVPKGTTYVVSEASYDGYESDVEGALGTVAANLGSVVSVTNTYSTSGSFSVSATKSLESLPYRTLQEGEFSFGLYVATGDEVQSVAGELLYEGSVYDEYLGESSAVCTWSAVLSSDALAGQDVVVECGGAWYVVESGSSLPAGSALVFSLAEGEEGYASEEEALAAASSAALVEVVSNAEDGTVSFSSVELTWPGTYTYYVKEVSGDDSSVVYDGTVWEVTVVAEDDGAGRLSCAVYSDDEAVAFVNGVETGSLEIDKEAVNTTDACEGEQFAFEVLLYEEEGGEELSGSYPYVVYGEDGEAVSEGEVESGGTILLEASQYAVVSGLPGYCWYSVSEVDVPDGYESELSGEEGMVMPLLTSVVSATNTYSSSGSWTPAASKTVTGGVDVGEAEFTFALLSTDILEGELVSESSFEGDEDEGTMGGETLVFAAVLEHAYALGDYVVAYVDGWYYTFIVEVSGVQAGDEVTFWYTEYEDGSVDVASATRSETLVDALSVATLQYQVVATGYNASALYARDGSDETTMEVVWTVVGDSLSYDESDDGATYVYYMFEYEGDDEDIDVYADSVVRVEASVSDNGDGTLTIAVTYDGEEAAGFVNVFNHLVTLPNTGGPGALPLLALAGGLLAASGACWLVGRRGRRRLFEHGE